MKLPAILLCLCLLSCAAPTERELAVEAWINDAPKPIRVNRARHANSYVLVDANGTVFITGMTRLNLPDTIQAIRP